MGGGNDRGVSKVLSIYNSSSKLDSMSNQKGIEVAIGNVVGDMHDTLSPLILLWEGARAHPL